MHIVYAHYLMTNSRHVSRMLKSNFKPYCPLPLFVMSTIQISGFIVLKIQQHHNTSLCQHTKQPCLSVWLLYIRNQSGEGLRKPV